MPAKSGKQYRFMAAKAFGDGKGPGPSKEVAKEFIDETPKDKKSLFSKKKGKEKRKSIFEKRK